MRRSCRTPDIAPASHEGRSRTPGTTPRGGTAARRWSRRASAAGRADRIRTTNQHGTANCRQWFSSVERVCVPAIASNPGANAVGDPAEQRQRSSRPLNVAAVPGHGRHCVPRGYRFARGPPEFAVADDEPVGPRVATLACSRRTPAAISAYDSYAATITSNNASDAATDALAAHRWRLWGLSRITTILRAAWHVQSSQGPFCSLPGPLQSLQGPLQSLQRSLQPLQRSFQSLHGPLRSLQRPLRSLHMLLKSPAAAADGGDGGVDRRVLVLRKEHCHVSGMRVASSARSSSSRTHGRLGRECGGDRLVVAPAGRPVTRRASILSDPANGTLIARRCSSDERVGRDRIHARRQPRVTRLPLANIPAAHPAGPARHAVPVEGGPDS